MVYKNTSEHELVIPGVGSVKAGETIESSVTLENAQLQLVEQVNQAAQLPTQEKREEIK